MGSSCFRSSVKRVNWEVRGLPSASSNFLAEPSRRRGVTLGLELSDGLLELHLLLFSEPVVLALDLLLHEPPGA